VAFLYGVIAKKSKADLIVDQLWATRALPMWGPYIQSWYSRYVIVKAGGQDPGQNHAFNTPINGPDVTNPQSDVDHSQNEDQDDGDRDDDRDDDERDQAHHSTINDNSNDNKNNNDDNDDDSNSSDSDSSSSSTHSTGSRSKKPANKRKRSPITHNDANQVLGQLSKAISALAKSNSGSKPKTGQSKKTKFLRDAQKCIDRGDFIDLELLGSRHLNKLTSSTYKDEKIKLANGLFITKMDGEEDQGLRAGQVREGMDAFLRMTRESKKVKIQQRATDRTLFNEKVWSLPIGTFSEKAEFVKKFFAENHAKTNWVDRMSSDNVMLRILKTDNFDKPRRPSSDYNNNRNSRPQPYRPFPPTPRPFQNGARSYGGGSYYRTDGNTRADGNTRSDGNNRPSNSKPKYCPTRLDKNAGRCSKGRYCLLEHRCASCDGWHAAAQCPQWDDQKAAANAARRG
jgi:hypothetical protein